MVERVIRVTVDPSGARQGLGQVRREVDSTTSSLGGLKAAAGGVVAALGIAEMAKYADTWTLINNRIKLVTSSSEEQVAIQHELLKLANETRSPLEATAELYSRVARSTQELGLSQRDTLEVTKSINQAIQISGATAAEAGAGVIQFAQGLASGALRGDELRSVLEQMPRLARALADGLGVGIGQLRELGAAGKLSTEDILGALQSQAPQLAKEFEQLTPTISSAFTVLDNELLATIGNLSDATGSGKAFSSTMIELGQWLNEHQQDIALFGQAFKTSFTERITEAVAITKIAGARLTLFFAEVSNAVDEFQNKLNLGDDEELLISRKTVEFAKANLEEVTKTAVAEADATLKQIGKSAEAEVQKIITAGKSVNLDVKKAKIERPTVDTAAEKAREKAEKSAEALLAQFKKQAVELELNRTLQEKATGALREYEIQQMATAGATADTVAALREANAALSEQEELTRKAKLVQEDTKFIETMQQELDLLKMTNEERVKAVELQNLSSEATDGQKAQVGQLATEIDKLKNAQDKAFKFTETIAEQTSNAIRGLIKEAFTGDLDSIQDKFSQFLVDLGQELLTSLFMQTLADAFTGAAGGGGWQGQLFGALGSAFGGKTGKAAGGTVAAGQATWVGEGNRPEIFIPKQDGRIVPLDKLGGSGGNNMRGLESMVAELIQTAKDNKPTVVNINEQDPQALLSVMRTREGVKEQRNFVHADQRKINRTLGSR